MHISTGALRSRASIVFARGPVISPRQAISCSTELASVTMSCGATSLCPRSLAKPTGVWHAATATDASTTSSFVNGRCASDGARRPSWAPGYRHLRPATPPAARTSDTARPRSRAGRGHRSRAWHRRVVPEDAQSESNDGQSQGSYSADRQPQRQSTCRGWYAKPRTPEAPILLRQLTGSFSCRAPAAPSLFPPTQPPNDAPT